MDTTAEIPTTFDESVVKKEKKKKKRKKDEGEEPSEDVEAMETEPVSYLKLLFVQFIVKIKLNLLLFFICCRKLKKKRRRKKRIKTKIRTRKKNRFFLYQLTNVFYIKFLVNLYQYYFSLLNTYSLI